MSECREYGAHKVPELLTFILNPDRLLPRWIGSLQIHLTLPLDIASGIMPVCHYARLALM
jgi:hypothetical protein